MSLHAILMRGRESPCGLDAGGPSVAKVLAFASILDDAQDLSSVVLAVLVFGALFLLLKALARA